MKADERWMNWEDVKAEIHMGRSFCYQVIRELNQELEALGYRTVEAKIPREYFNQRYAIYGVKNPPGRRESS